MDQTQTRIIELLREVHLIALKEFERLNMRIAELESLNRTEKPIPKPAVKEPPAVNPPAIKPPSLSKMPEMLNEHQVAGYLNMSVATVRRWRVVRKGPKFVKIGSAVRYKRADVETWVNSCPGLK
jgi:excisionase family DNA binding protein